MADGVWRLRAKRFGDQRQRFGGALNLNVHFHALVLDGIIMPDQPLALHRHDHGRTIVALRGGTLDVVDGSGRTVKTMTWETGKAYWLDVDPPGEQHGDLNRGPDPIEVVVVEMRR